MSLSFYWTTHYLYYVVPVVSCSKGGGPIRTMLSVYYKRLEQSTLGCSNLEHFTYVSSICIVLIGTDCYFNISSIVLRIWTLLWSFSIIYSRFFIEIVFPTPICLFLTDFLGLQIYLICSEVNVCNTTIYHYLEIGQWPQEHPKNWFVKETCNFKVFL